MNDAKPVYTELAPREPWPDRPWIAINMIATIDGKILSGHRDENVMDLGSDVDHATLRALEGMHDAVMIGAGTLRATKGLWFAKPLTRIVVSASGNVNYKSRFFTDAPQRAWVVTGEGTEVPENVQTVRSGPPVVWSVVLGAILSRIGVARLLVEGGSDLNGSLFKEDLIDEVFLTVAPKIKLGQDVPTIADGDPLDRGSLLDFALVGNLSVGDELFLHYLRSR